MELFPWLMQKQRGVDSIFACRLLFHKVVFTPLSGVVGRIGWYAVGKILLRVQATCLVTANVILFLLTYTVVLKSTGNRTSSWVECSNEYVFRLGSGLAVGYRYLGLLLETALNLGSQQPTFC